MTTCLRSGQGAIMGGGGTVSRLLLAISVLFAVLPGGAADVREDDPRPNIIFIMTDDQGSWALGSAGTPNVITPNLDRLREQGALLKSCYSPTPVCSPARASLLTSRYGSEIGITDYLPAESTQSLAGDHPTWPRVLVESGYATGLIGKYHCGERPESHPTKIGYQEFSGFIRGAMTSKDPMMEIRGQMQRAEGWTEDLLTDLAVNFIRRKSAKPFALSLHFWAPHANEHVNAEGDRTWMPLRDEDLAAIDPAELRLPEPDYPNLDAARNQRMLREYLASVHSVDRNVGKVLALLEELNLTNKTVIIFTSDHGYNLGHHGIWHKGNGRWLLKDNRTERPNMWDNSLRVPAIVSWPGVVPPGSSVDEMTSHLDWFPTIAGIAGAKIPETAILRGRDIQTLLRGGRLGEEREFFAQYIMRGGSDMRSYQTRRWKLVRYLDQKLPDEFYDRIGDPMEKNNLITSQDEVVRKAAGEMKDKLHRAMAMIADPAL